MLVPMARVEIIGPKNRFFEVVTLLHEQGTLHIEDLTKKIGSGEMPVEKMAVAVGQAGERERMEDLLIRVRAIIKALHLPGSTVDEVAPPVPVSVSVQVEPTSRGSYVAV